MRTELGLLYRVPLEAQVLRNLHAYTADNTKLVCRDSRYQ